MLANLLGVLGIGMMIGALVWWAKNRSAGTKSYAPAALGGIGTLTTLGWFSTYSFWNTLAFVGFIWLLVSLIFFLYYLYRRNMYWKPWAGAAALSLVLTVVGGANAEDVPKTVATDQPAKQEQKQETKQVSQALQPTSAPAEQKPSEQPTQQQAKPAETKPKPAVAVIPVVVSRVIDGDTFEAKVNGKTERIRMIGVDTPEVHGKVEAYGKEASTFTKKQLTGKKVFLELDVQERDKYGRLLAYVWLSQPTTLDDKSIRSQMFNARLLLNGYAEQMTVPPNVKYANKFTVYVREAREAKRGLWGATQQQASTTANKGTTNKSTTSNQTASANKPRSVKGTGSYDCPPGYPVKGNINSRGEKIYHVPGGQFYDRTKPEYCFCTPADAEAAGFRASKR